jgi:hypothetical protein
MIIKDFLLKVLLFVLIVSTLLIMLVFFSDFAIRQREGQLLWLSEDISIVFSGDSYVECAVDDNIVGHSINIAESGEAYLYSYVKLKSLIDNNKNIKVVFLGFSYGDVLMEKEIDWLFSDQFVIEKVQHYNYLLSSSEKALLFNRNPQAYLKGVVKSVYYNLVAVLKSYYSSRSGRKLINFGGYKYLVRDKLQVDPGIELYKSVPVEKSAVQEKYLGLISDLCRDKSVRLVLFETPKYKTYNMNVDDNVRQIWLNVRNSFPGDSLLNLSEFTLPDSCYGDLTHVNYRGARIFSRYLNNLIDQSSAGDTVR